MDKIAKDRPIFPFLYSAGELHVCDTVLKSQYSDLGTCLTFTDDLRTYWSTVNVAVGLLLATAGTFLATILTALDPRIRSGRHYMAWALLCFTTTLLISLTLSPLRHPDSTAAESERRRTQSWLNATC